MSADETFELALGNTETPWDVARGPEMRPRRTKPRRATVTTPEPEVPGETRREILAALLDIGREVRGMRKDLRAMSEHLAAPRERPRLPEDLYGVSVPCVVCEARDGGCVMCGQTGRMSGKLAYSFPRVTIEWLSEHRRKKGSG